MMNTTELSAVKAAAERYQFNGYEINFETSGSPLPEQVGAYRPDFVATLGDQHVAVEVELRSTLQNNQEIRRVAELFRSLPGWRFDIVVVPDGPVTVAESKLLSSKSYQTRLKSADVLAGDLDDVAGAILLLWTTIESALRAGIGEPDDSQVIAGARLAKEAFSLGLVTKKEWETLERLVAVRNQVVHGEQPSRITKATYKNARSIASRLIGHIPQI